MRESRLHPGPLPAAILDGQWKGIRSTGTNAAFQLYDLKRDFGETINLAAKKPALVARISQYFDTARSESADWPVRAVAKPTAENPARKQSTP